MKTEEFPMCKGFYAQIKKLLMLFCLLFSLSLITSCSDSEDEPKEETQEETTGSTGSNSEPSGSINGHEYVDLGLPSGLLWATCNVGATNPEDYGDYYAWGEITTKTEYTTSNSLTNSKTMGDISGNAEYDVARANWGGTWRIPTYTEIRELISDCTWTWTSKNRVNGYEVIGPNGNSIFLPATGYRYGSSIYTVGSCGNYWTSMPDDSYTDIAYALGFEYDYYSTYASNSFYGHSVRPITSYYRK